MVETFPAQQSHETKMSVKARERLMREVGQRTNFKIDMTKKVFQGLHGLDNFTICCCKRDVHVVTMSHAKSSKEKDPKNL